MNVEIQILNPEITEIPSYATKGSAGFDLIACNFKSLFKGDKELNLNSSDSLLRSSMESGYIQLRPLERLVVGCGFKIAIPEGYEMQIRPRSGMASKRGITVANSPGTIDSDFRGEVCIVLINLTTYLTKQILLGDRIAQGVITKCDKVTFKSVNSLDNTERGEGGFGHTGN